MQAILRTLRADEGVLLKKLFVTMSVETPTAFAGTVGELEQRTVEEWQRLATDVASSPSLEGFVIENEGEAVGFVTAAILTKKRLAIFEESKSDDDSLSDSTILGRMWVSSQVRGQGLAQLLIDAVLDWARSKGQRRVILAVTNGNEAAMRAYMRASFVPTGYSIPHPNYPDLPINMMEFVL